MTSDKIRPHHLDRKAILYVRQSSSHQVLHNRESRALQYAMRDRLTGLGWSEIAIIDDDLGRSAAGSVTRAGFERMVAEVCLGKVGAVAAREAEEQPVIALARRIDRLPVDEHRVDHAAHLDQLLPITAVAGEARHLRLSCPHRQRTSPQRRQTPHGTVSRSAKPLLLNDIDRWVL